MCGFYFIIANLVKKKKESCYYHCYYFKYYEKITFNLFNLVDFCKYTSKLQFFTFNPFKISFCYNIHAVPNH